jgi:hypothetical protein
MYCVLCGVIHSEYLLQYTTTCFGLIGHHQVVKYSCKGNKQGKVGQGQKAKLKNKIKLKANGSDLAYL